MGPGNQGSKRGNWWSRSSKSMKHLVDRARGQQKYIIQFTASSGPKIQFLKKGNKFGEVGYYPVPATESVPAGLIAYAVEEYQRNQQSLMGQKIDVAYHMVVTTPSRNDNYSARAVSFIGSQRHRELHESLRLFANPYTYTQHLYPSSTIARLLVRGNQGAYKFQCVHGNGSESVQSYLRQWLNTPDHNFPNSGDYLGEVCCVDDGAGLRGYIVPSTVSSRSYQWVRADSRVGQQLISEEQRFADIAAHASRAQENTHSVFFVYGNKARRENIQIMYVSGDQRLAEDIRTHVEQSEPMTLQEQGRQNYNYIHYDSNGQRFALREGPDVDSAPANWQIYNEVREIQSIINRYQPVSQQTRQQVYEHKDNAPGSPGRVGDAAAAHQQPARARVPSVYQIPSLRHDMTQVVHIAGPPRLDADSVLNTIRYINRSRFRAHAYIMPDGTAGLAEFFISDPEDQNYGLFVHWVSPEDVMLNHARSMDCGAYGQPNGQVYQHTDPMPQCNVLFPVELTSSGAKVIGVVDLLSKDGMYGDVDQWLFDQRDSFPRVNPGATRYDLIIPNLYVRPGEPRFSFFSQQNSLTPFAFEGNYPAIVSVNDRGQTESSKYFDISKFSLEILRGGVFKSIVVQRYYSSLGKRYIHEIYDTTVRNKPQICNGLADNYRTTFAAVNQELDEKVNEIGYLTFYLFGGEIVAFDEGSTPFVVRQTAQLHFNNGISDVHRQYHLEYGTSLDQYGGPKPIDTPHTQRKSRRKTSRADSGDNHVYLDGGDAAHSQQTLFQQAQPPTDLKAEGKGCGSRTARFCDDFGNVIFSYSFRFYLPWSIAGGFLLAAGGAAAFLGINGIINSTSPYSNVSSSYLGLGGDSLAVLAADTYFALPENQIYAKKAPVVSWGSNASDFSAVYAGDDGEPSLLGAVECIIGATATYMLVGDGADEASWTVAAWDIQGGYPFFSMPPTDRGYTEAPCYQLCQLMRQYNLTEATLVATSPDGQTFVELPYVTCLEELPVNATVSAKNLTTIAGNVTDFLPRGLVARGGFEAANHSALIDGSQFLLRINGTVVKGVLVLEQGGQILANITLANETLSMPLEGLLEQVVKNPKIALTAVGGITAISSLFFATVVAFRIAKSLAGLCCLRGRPYHTQNQLFIVRMAMSLIQIIKSMAMLVVAGYVLPNELAAVPAILDGWPAALNGTGLTYENVLQDFQTGFMGFVTNPRYMLFAVSNIAGFVLGLLNGAQGMGQWELDGEISLKQLNQANNIPPVLGLMCIALIVTQPTAAVAKDVIIVNAATDLAMALVQHMAYHGVIGSTKKTYLLGERQRCRLGCGDAHKGNRKRTQSQRKKDAQHAGNKKCFGC